MRSFRSTENLYYVTASITTFSIVFGEFIRKSLGIFYKDWLTILGILMLFTFIDTAKLLYSVLVRGDEINKVSTVLRESGLYQMEQDIREDRRL